MRFVSNRYATLDAVIADRAGLLQAGVAEGAKQVIEEKLCLTFFVAANVFAAPGDEPGERDGKVKGQKGRPLLCVK